MNIEDFVYQISSQKEKAKNEPCHFKLRGFGLTLREQTSDPECLFLESGCRQSQERVQEEIKVVKIETL